MRRFVFTSWLLLLVLSCLKNVCAEEASGRVVGPDEKPVAARGLTTGAKFPSRRMPHFALKSKYQKRRLQKPIPMRRAV